MTALSYQLYSSRMFPPLEDTLMMLSDLGYAHVEGYGALVADGEAMNALERGLKETGLTMPSCHVGLDQCEADIASVIATAQRFGIETVVIPFIMPDDRASDVAGWEAYANRLNAISAPLIDAGLELAYHNHDFEYAVMEGGTYPMDIILNTAPDVGFEYDVAWGVRAGIDPMAPIKTYGARITHAHVKDIAPIGQAQDEDGWADVGHGTMDWPALLEALQAAGTKYFIMEHDNPNDHVRFAQRSFETVNDI